MREPPHTTKSSPHEMRELRTRRSLLRTQRGSLSTRRSRLRTRRGCTAHVEVVSARNEGASSHDELVSERAALCVSPIEYGVVENELRPSLRRFQRLWRGSGRGKSRRGSSASRRRRRGGSSATGCASASSTLTCHLSACSVGDLGDDPLRAELRCHRPVLEDSFTVRWPSEARLSSIVDLGRQRQRPPRRRLAPSGGPAPRHARRLFRLPWPSKPLIWLRDTLRCRSARGSQPHARRRQLIAPRRHGFASLPCRSHLGVQRRPPLHQLPRRLHQLRLSLHQRSPRRPSSRMALIRRNPPPR